MHKDVEKILVSEEVIQHRIEVLAKRVLEKGEDNIVIVVLLKGALVFASDLFRSMPVMLDVECLNVSSYHGGLESSGEVKFLDVKMPNFDGKRVIVVDDIYDTGLTMKAVCDKIGESGAASVESCVLLAKDKVREVDFEPDYVGFTIGDEFVIGYGLDYKGKYRNLPYIGVLSVDAI
ncbi:MAG: hypoxanthine phosphoribosyltransferase [Akkermansiaceae bacterium]